MTDRTLIVVIIQSKFIARNAFKKLPSKQTGNCFFVENVTLCWSVFPNIKPDADQHLNQPQR